MLVPFGINTWINGTHIDNIIKASANKNAIGVFAIRAPNILRTSDELSLSNFF